MSLTTRLLARSAWQMCQAGGVGKHGQTVLVMRALLATGAAPAATAAASTAVAKSAQPQQPVKKGMLDKLGRVSFRF